MLRSSSQSNVASGRRMMVDARSATTSYLRFSRLSSEPSPNQPPAGTPISEASLPSGLPTETFTSPEATPSHAVARSPLRSMSAPAGYCVALTSCSTRSRSSGPSSANQAEDVSSVCSRLIRTYNKGVTECHNNDSYTKGETITYPSRLPYTGQRGAYKTARPRPAPDKVQGDKGWYNHQQPRPLACRRPFPHGLNTMPASGGRGPPCARKISASGKP